MNWCELKYYDWLTWCEWFLYCFFLGWWFEAAREDGHCDSLSLGTGLWMLSIWVSYFLIARGKIFWNTFQRSFMSQSVKYSSKDGMSFTKTKPQKKRQRHSESEMENGQGLLLYCIYDYGGGLSSIWKNILASGYNTVPSYNLYASFFQTSECSMHWLWPSQRQTFHCSLSKTKLIDSEKEQQSRFARF